MINLFSHYVPGRLVVLAALEGVVLLIAAQVGISLPFAGSGAAIPALARRHRLWQLSLRSA